MRISGRMFSDRLLRIGEGVHVALADEAGHEVASGFGRIASATKREREEKDGGTATELIFVAKVT